MKLANQYIPALKYGAKVLPSEIANFGMATFGNVYWVDADNGADTNAGDTAATAFKTITKAMAIATTNNNDVIMLSANGAHVQTSMLTVAKNRLHFVGTGLRDSAVGMGARTKITMEDTVVAADLAVMTNTGVGNTFSNIKFDSGTTLGTSLYGVLEGGEYAVYNNCEIVKHSLLTTTGAADLVANGDSTQYVNCYIGTTGYTGNTGAIIRANVLFTQALAGVGLIARDNVFSGCILGKRCGNAANRFVYWAAATDIERLCIFDNCVFYNVKDGTAPGACISSGAALTGGSVLCVNPSFINATKLATGDASIFVTGAATGATAGLATQAA